MARFMGSLKHEIAHLIELHHYGNIDNMLQMAIKVEKQFKTRPQSQRNPLGSPFSW